MRSLRYPRQQLRLLGVLLAAVVLSTACSSSDQSNGSETGGSSGSPLRVVVPSEPASYNPVISVYTTLRVVGPVFDPLVGIDKMTLEPNDSGLLTAWEQVSLTEWRFTVRQGVTFHNGEVWDAEAAAFTIERYRDEPRSNFAPFFTPVASTRVESAETLIVTTEMPYIALPKVFTTAMGVPPKAFAEVDVEDFGRAPIGTGPFEYDSVELGQSFSVKAFPDYWGGAPELTGITFSWVPDAATRAALVQSGGADLVVDLPNELVAEVDNTPGVSVVNAPSLYKMFLGLNTLAGTLEDPDLRKAVQAAIDYEAIVETLFGGVGARPSPYFTGDLLPIPPDLAYQQHDPARAQELVAASGGTPTIRYIYSTGFYPKDNQVGEAVAAMLEAVGFDVEQVPLEYPEVRRQRGEGNYDIFMVQTSPTFAHPDSLVGFFTGSNAAVDYCTDPDGYDALRAEALSAEQEASDEIYEQIERRMTDGDACNIVLYDQVISYGMSDQVQGFEPALDAVPLLYVLNLEQ